MTKHHNEDKKRREENKLEHLKEKELHNSKKQKRFAIKLVAALIIIFILVIPVINWLTNTGTSSKKETIISVETIMVDGVQEINLTWNNSKYYPQVIVAKKDIPLKIIADTNKLVGCFRYIQIPQLTISKFVSENDNIIEFTPTVPGRYLYKCYMGMGTGTLIVQ